MNKNLLEKMEAFLKEATPDYILANCKKYGCIVEDIEENCSSNTFNETSFKTDPNSEFNCDLLADKSFKSEEHNNPNYALAA